MILFLLISLVMMIMLYITILDLSNIMDVQSKSIVVESRLNDIANAVANDLVGAVIFLPHNTTLHYKKDIPSEITGEGCSVIYENESVKAMSGSHQTRVFISGIRYEINGSISSSGVGVLWINVSR